MNESLDIKLPFCSNCPKRPNPLTEGATTVVNDSLGHSKCSDFDFCHALYKAGYQKAKNDFIASAVTMFGLRRQPDFSQIEEKD